jgi:polyvinyl alcohol dehydrogenase (cytochrome)
MSSRVAWFVCAAFALAGCASDDDPIAIDEPPPSGSWTSFGGGLDHSRSNPEEWLINRDSAGRLEERWRVDAPGVSSTPAVWGLSVYWADWAGGVHATSLADGSEIWTQTLPVGSTSSPCVTANRLYVSDRANTVHALDRATGDIVWEHSIESTLHARLWSSPVVSKNVLVIGLAGIGTQMAGVPIPDEQLNAFRGAVVALNAATGEPLWRFETTLGPDGEAYGAGVSVWSSASIDEELGLAYIGTGNTYFKPASPYSDSLLALRLESGELAWHRQFTAGDAFRAADRSGGPDFDVGAVPNLFEAAGRKLVGVGDKSGTYHVLDRETGEQVWWAWVTSGSATGGIIAPAAVSDGVVYVNSNESVTESVLVALAAVNGRELFRKPLGIMTFAAPAVAGGVVFAGPRTEDMFAVSAADGSELWHGTAPFPKGGGFAVSGGLVLLGTGFHFYQDATEPIQGALVAYGSPP